MRRIIHVLSCLGMAAVLALPLAACGDRDAKPEITPPAPTISARGNPAQDIDPLHRHVPITTEITPLAMAEVENFDIRRGRAYPMQPPTIPHSIDGYQVDLNSNRCMLCHARSTAAQFQAPEVSVTHYMDRDDQFLRKSELVIRKAQWEDQFLMAKWIKLLEPTFQRDISHMVNDWYARKKVEGTAL